MGSCHERPEQGQPENQLPGIRLAALRLAQAAVTATERGQQRGVIQRVAQDLREATRECAPADVASPILRALAIEIAALGPGLGRDLGDLRVFARLSLPECADVLQADREQVAGSWRRTKALLFERVRQRLTRLDKDPLPLPSNRGEHAPRNSHDRDHQS